MVEPEKLNVESVISRLLEFRGNRMSRSLHITETELRNLCLKSREVLLSQPMLLELESPLKIVGNLHGQFADLLRIIEYGQFENNFLFLGDYVDFGKQSVETISLLLAYKIKYPEGVYLLRGHHEAITVNRVFGFYEECRRKYTTKLWKAFNEVFNCMPVAAIVDEKIFCVHGGLSPYMEHLDQIKRIIRPTEIPQFGILRDLLWSDPEPVCSGWGHNDRGMGGHTYGAEVVTKFLQTHDFELICRSHTVVENGYEFFNKRKHVTIFSAPNFRTEFENSGAIMSVSENLECSFQVLKSKGVSPKSRGSVNTMGQKMSAKCAIM